MEETKKFRGGIIGNYSPLIAAVGFLVYAGLNQSNANGYVIAFFMAVIIGAVFARSPEEYGQACINGVAKSFFPLISMAIILASICGKMISGSGLIQTIACYVIRANVTGGMFAAFSFAACCILSFSTGTSVGTHMISFPILYPVGVLVGVDPAFMAGALVSGAIFGDNLAPISDTTIASAGTQGADMGDVVRTRVLYSIPTALIVLVLMAVFAGNGDVQGAQEAAAGMTPNGRSLIMLLVPVTIIILCLKHVHLVVSLSAGAVVSIAAGLLSGIYKLSDIFTFPGGFSVDGIFIKAVTGTASTIYMLLGLFCLIGVLEWAGHIDQLGEKMMHRVHGVRSAEIAIVACIAVLSWITGVVTVAIVSLGEIVAKVGGKAGLNKYRRANLMDCGGLALGSLVPWSVHAIIPVQLATANVEGLSLTPIDVVTHNYYAIVMILMLVFMIITGFGRNQDPSVKKYEKINECCRRPGRAAHTQSH